MGWVRHAVDVVVRGAQTVRANPVYPLIPDELVPVRLRKGLGEQPPGGHRDQFLRSAPRLARLHRRAFASDRLDEPRGTARQSFKGGLRADVLFAGEDAVDPSRAVQMLRSEFGIERILLEGGPTLNYYFLRQRVVDEFFLDGGAQTDRRRGRAVFGRRAGRIRPVRSA